MIRLSAARRRSKVTGPRLVRDLSAIPGYWAGYRQTFTLSEPNITKWSEESGITARDLTPAGSNPSSKRYHFGGFRGVDINQTLDLASPQTFSPPYEVWTVVEIDSIPTHQYVIQSDNAADDRLILATDGRVRWRIDNTNRDVAPASTVTTGNIYVIGVMCDASGNLTCEVNGIVHDESVSDTDSWEFGMVGHNNINQHTYIGGLYIFDNELSADSRARVRRELQKFQSGTIATVGFSNTNDVSDGAIAIGWNRMYHATTGYNNNALKDWYDGIGDTANPPWLTFINEASKTASGGHPHIEKIWFHIGIAVSTVGESLATRKTWLTDVLAEARAQLVTAGHAADMPVSFSPMARYPDPTVSCSIMSSGAYDEAMELYEWAMSGRGAFCKRLKVYREVCWTYQKCEC